jgi:hypothetical protein
MGRSLHGGEGGGGNCEIPFRSGMGIERGISFSSLGGDGSLFSAGGVRSGGCPTSPYLLGSVRLWIVSRRELGQKFLRDRLEFLFSGALYCLFHHS